MHVPVASVLGMFFAVSEGTLAVTRRAGARAAKADRGSLALLWGVIVASVCLAIGIAHRYPQAAFGPRVPFECAGAAVFACGLVLRWYAILHLGRFFTVNVAIASDHRLIDSGPYRRVRHPSYTGSLLAFLGLGISMCNVASLSVLIVPTCLVFLWRMRVEEEALMGALGEQYRAYMQRTHRLIPALY